MKRRTERSLLVLVAGLAVAVSVLLLSERKREPGGGSSLQARAAAAGDADAPHENEPQPETSASRAAAEFQPAGDETGEDTARAFFGPDFHAAATAYRERGLDLSQVAALRDWEDCYPLLEGHMRISEEHVEALITGLTRWPESLDAAFLAQRFGHEGPIDEILLGEIEEIAEPVNAEVNDLAAAAMEELRKVVERQYRTQAFIRRPYANVLVEPTAEKTINSGTAFVNGWHVSWIVRDEDCPAVDPLLQEARDLSFDRDRKIRDLLKRMR